MPSIHIEPEIVPAVTNKIGKGLGTLSREFRESCFNREKLATY